jgi:hypothetical protein
LQRIRIAVGTLNSVRVKLRSLGVKMRLNEQIHVASVTVRGRKVFERYENAQREIDTQ